MASAEPLQYDVKVSGLLPATGEPLPNGERPHWSPLAHTLIHGPTEAALVDPPITVAQTAALGDWIEAHGRRLAYIYITHWHADHWLGTSELVARFPGAVVYASPATVRRMAESTPGGVPAAPGRRDHPDPAGCPEDRSDHPARCRQCVPGGSGAASGGRRQGNDRGLRRVHSSPGAASGLSSWPAGPAG